MDAAKKDNVGNKISKSQSDEEMCKAFGDQRKVFVWSLPHGYVGDTVLDGLMPYLRKDDIIIDCANENWQNTERRIAKSAPKGIRY
ncbi:UNVERIFIED_CONTAM: NAD(P)-binding domain-containing protein, partial [Bacteroidetes bacterium 56_B9]